MYKENRHLEVADARLILYFAWKEELSSLLDAAKEISARLDTFGVSNQASVVIGKKQKSYSNNIIEMLCEEEEAWRKYGERTTFVESVDRIFSELTPDEKELLKLKYIRRLTLRQIGDIKNYSHVQVMRILDDILDRF